MPISLLARQMVRVDIFCGFSKHSRWRHSQTRIGGRRSNDLFDSIRSLLLLFFLSRFISLYRAQAVSGYCCARNAHYNTLQHFPTRKLSPSLAHTISHDRVGRRLAVTIRLASSVPVTQYDLKL